ncbi:MAG: MoaD/ThiS family protein [Gammaproteobacteria bacterium]
MSNSSPESSTRIRIEYFALLREHVGYAHEELNTTASTVGELYAELDQRHAFPSVGGVKVAVNDEFRDWNAPLSDGDFVVFIPPVAGG